MGDQDIDASVIQNIEEEFNYGSVESKTTNFKEIEL